MPFTFSHPAIVLPLAKIHKNKLSATAVIIGSMAPDFEYFIRMEMYREHSHSLGGMLFFELPVTLLCCVIYHWLVRDSLIKALPEPIQNRFSEYVGIDLFGWLRKYWYVLIYSALIGAFSHIFWDAFTHSTGYFARRIPFLQETTTYFGVEMRNCDWGQLFSTLVGGMVILLAIILPIQGSVNWKKLLPKARYWITVFAILMIVLLLRNVQNLGDVIATTIAGGLLGLVFAPVVLKALRFGR